MTFNLRRWHWPPTKAGSNFVTVLSRFNGWPRGSKYLPSIKKKRRPLYVQGPSLSAFYHLFFPFCVLCNVCEACQRKRAKQTFFGRKHSLERSRTEIILSVRAWFFFFFGSNFPVQCPKGFCVKQDFLKDTKSNKCRIILSLHSFIWQVYKWSKIQSKHRAEIRHKSVERPDSGSLKAWGIYTRAVPTCRGPINQPRLFKKPDAQWKRNAQRKTAELYFIHRNKQNPLPRENVLDFLKTEINMNIYEAFIHYILK